MGTTGLPSLDGLTGNPFGECENLISAVVEELPKRETNYSLIFKDDRTTLMVKVPFRRYVGHGQSEGYRAQL